MPPYGPRNPHPLSTRSGELVWEGKYDVYGRRREAVLPDPPPQPAWMEAWSPAEALRGMEDGNGKVERVETPWRNQLIQGDNLLVLAHLRKAFRGRMQLIYIDPPFDVGTEFNMHLTIGGGDWTHPPAERGGERVPLRTYGDRWGRGNDSYLQMMYERVSLMRDLLSETGCLFVHCDWRSNSQLRLMLDEVFGRERFVNEIVWHYYNKYSAGTRCLPRAHDTVLLYAKGPQPALNELRLPREQPRRQLVRENVDGVLRNARDAQGRLRYRLSTDRKGDDVWRIPQLQPASHQWTGYSTQKHHDLLRRVIALCSREGDLVADFFCGSGTTLAMAETLGRRWIGCDLGRMAIHTTRKRLLLFRGPPAPPPTDAWPFDVLDLGTATRHRWYRDIAGGTIAAYRHRVLEAFGATPLSPPPHSGLHGERSDGVCHVAGITAVPTDRSLRPIARAAAAAGAQRLYCLAWTFAPDIRRLVERWRTDGGMEVVLVVIPPELTEPAGTRAPQFRAAPGVRLAPLYGWDGRGRETVDIQIQDIDFGPDLSPGDAGRRPRATGRSPGKDLLDGWSVDFTWVPGKPFTHQWWAFRTHRRRALPTVSEAAYVYGEEAQDRRPHRRRAAVMTVDVFGCATLHTIEV